ncbi:hypothetical protein J0X14_02910 [Muricauda sp. CAU 1633]|uniref:hypothetical protein n=1 Tax=Allomuricauda sp. CAU 1633 TaxID=2816036 RepID=UPI001A8FACA4|nr:hypothetical protein [Muricauda sp. CAU 1633]MBO0321232.1 hypothetical protein [Muricauda sp. CAU 1633]
MINQKNNATLLVSLCILTIIGSIFTMARAYFYEMASMIEGNNYYVGDWVYADSAIGTLMGAFFMIQRKRIGLYIYTLFQSVYISRVLITTLMFKNFINGSDKITYGFATFFLIPSIIFLILYWTKPIRSQLK